MSIDPTTIVFAFVAIFVCWRLWSVLGTRTGAGRPPLPARGPGAPAAAPATAPRAVERWQGVAEPGGKLASGLDAVADGDPSFDAQHFLSGARAAYEMITAAFAAGNLETLRGLLAPEPLANFSRAIEERQAAGHKMVVTLVSLDKAEIVEAGVSQNSAAISVRFASKMNSSTTDRSGAVVEGSATQVADHVDVWTFSRPLASRDPNWLLAATEAPH